MTILSFIHMLSLHNLLPMGHGYDLKKISKTLALMTVLLIYESSFSIHLGVSYYMVIVTDSASSAAGGKAVSVAQLLWLRVTPLLLWVLLLYITD